mmetsp:Transcript_9351/g.16107  ORF Transcript_9351/g.16107 Transcript_9351/m.16107 type:complete len:81 (+) Transcript_9351:164-406(+)
MSNARFIVCLHAPTKQTTLPKHSDCLALGFNICAEPARTWSTYLWAGQRCAKMAGTDPSGTSNGVNTYITEHQKRDHLFT